MAPVAFSKASELYNCLHRPSSALTEYVFQIKDSTLFIQKGYVNGEWVNAQSGKTFSVYSRQSSLFATRSAQ